MKAKRSEPLKDTEEVSRTIIVRVSFYEDLHRVIELPEDSVLYDLHMAIQRAFGWDNDHLFLFTLSKKRNYYKDSYWEGDPAGDGPAGKVTLASLCLSPRRKFKYLFDFGDELWHEVQVLRFGALDSRETYPRILERHGENVDQYD